jgi:indole-3-glycerol phosphate synthase
MGILDRIVSKKKQRLKDSRANLSIRALKTKIDDLEKPRNFTIAIKRSLDEKIKLIAEVKKASPSKGVIRRDFDHLSIARTYEEKAVNAISVLTEEDYFKGSLAFLPEIKKISTIPILRKDFIFDEYQIYESRANEADAILLIAGILDKNQADEYLHLANELGLSVIFEVHNFEELEMALFVDSDIIGINNRNLDTLQVDMNTTFKLKKQIPYNKIVVSESGIKTRQDAKQIEDAGIDSVLIGTIFMEAEDIGKKIDEFMGKQ